MSTQDHQAQVREFMVAFGQETPPYPKMPSVRVIKLRTNLINEEFNEFVEALPDYPQAENDVERLAQIADSLADLLYVIYGAAIAFGIDIHPIFDEVHKSNMTKLGGIRRPDGKQMRGPNYQPPQVTNIVNYQISSGLHKVSMTMRGGVEWEGEQVSS